MSAECRCGRLPHTCDLTDQELLEIESTLCDDRDTVLALIAEVRRRRAERPDAKALVDQLTDAQRLELFAIYCHGCGCSNEGREFPCRCWDDE